jgi:ribonuclease HII
MSALALIARATASKTTRATPCRNREALDRLGPSIHHRRFFAPVVAARLKHYPETVEETVEPDLFTVDGAITSDISVTI